MPALCPESPSGEPLIAEVGEKRQFEAVLQGPADSLGRASQVSAIVTDCNVGPLLSQQEGNTSRLHSQLFNNEKSGGRISQSDF